MSVIDIGAAPGGWSQVIAQKIESDQNEKSMEKLENSRKGLETVVAVDLLEMVPIPGVKYV